MQQPEANRSLYSLSTTIPFVCSPPHLPLLGPPSSRSPVSAPLRPPPRSLSLHTHPPSRWETPSFLSPVTTLLHNPSRQSRLHFFTFPTYPLDMRPSYYTPPPPTTHAAAYPFAQPPSPSSRSNGSNSSDSSPGSPMPLVHFQKLAQRGNGPLDGIRRMRREVMRGEQSIVTEAGSVPDVLLAPSTLSP